MTTTPTEWLDDTSPNTNTNSNGDIVKIVQLTNGNFVVFWTDSSDNAPGDDNGTDIIGQRYSPLGEKIGSEFQANGGYFADDEGEFDVAALPNGGFVVVFEDTDTNGTSIRAVEWNASASSNTNRNITSDPGTDELGMPTVSVNSDGSYIVMYQVNDGADSDFVAKIVASNGTVGTEFNAIINSDQFAADIGSDVFNRNDSAVLSNGNYVLVTYDSRGDTAVAYTVRDSSGGSVSGASFVPGGDTANGVADEAVCVTALTGGGFVIAWISDGDLVAQRFDNSGSSQGSQIVVSAGTGANEPEVVGLQDGGFLVLWDSAFGSGQRYDASGATVGSVFSFANQSPSRFSATLLGDGRVAIGFNDDSFLAPHLTIWDPRDNTINGDPGDNILTGRQEATTLVGGGGNDVLYGVAGDDLIQGNAGIDVIYGGDGNDQLEGGGDTDYLFGEEGVDLIRGGGGSDYLNGGNGGDTLRGLAGNDVIEGENGLDLIEGAAGDDVLYGQAGADTMIGGDGADTMEGNDGADTMNGSAGDDDMEGGAGNDVMNGNAGIDTISGGSENDTIFGGGQDDLLQGNAGDDELRGGGDNDELQGGDGNDDLFGITGNDLLLGGAGDDDLFGGGGADTLNGGLDDDTLRGADGNDILIGGAGVDVLIGGSGADAFTFLSTGDSGTTLGARDQINDFSRAQGDSIDLSAIDADTGTGGNQAFQVVGSFTGIAGQLTITSLGGGDVLVALDVDGDSSADMAFEVSGQADLGAGDFVL